MMPGTSPATSEVADNANSVLEQFARSPETLVAVTSETVSDEAGRMREKLARILAERGVEVSYVELGESRKFEPNAVTEAVFSRDWNRYSSLNMAEGFDDAYRAWA